MTPDSDRELDELLADTAALRCRLRAESNGQVPPPHVDAAILAAARRSVNARPTLAGRSPWRRWQVPLAAAAVLVVATSLSLMVERSREPGLPIPTAERPAADVPARIGEAPVERGDVTANRRIQDLHRDAKGQEQSAKARVEASARERPARVPKDATGGIPEAARGQDDPAAQPAAPSVDATGADAQEWKREPQNHVDVPPARPQAQHGARPMHQEQAPARESPGPTTESGGQAAARSEAQRSPVPAAVRSAPAPAAGGAEARQKQLNSEEALRFSGPAPESTLLAIRKLWEEGHEQLARERLAEFLRQHPAYPLPPDFPVPRPAAGPFKERTPEGR
jgi:hypothetical protein